MYTVYMHITPNNKRYIGITKQKPKQRWNSGYGYIQNKYFFSAILKYGWNNIEHKVLFSNLSKEEAETKEVELISFYKSNNRNYGYNIEKGGHVNRGFPAWNKGKKTPLEIREKQKQAKIGKYTGAKHWNSKKVVNLETGKIYNSFGEIARELNIKNGSHIVAVCKGKKPSAYGYHWAYVEEVI